jgi:hypothetical protein
MLDYFMFLKHLEPQDQWALGIRIKLMNLSSDLKGYYCAYCEILFSHSPLTCMWDRLQNKFGKVLLLSEVSGR